MYSIIVAGSLSYDTIMDFPGRFADRIMPDKIHKISLGFLVDKLNKQFGGTAVNIAYTLKLLGFEPTVVAPAGNDFADFDKFLRSCGLSTAAIPVYKDEPCGCYFVVTDQDDNQIGSFYVGAMKYAKDLSIVKHLEGGRVERSGSHDSFQADGRDKQSFIVLSPTDPKAMVKYFKECQSQKLPYLYDPAFQIATFTDEELKEGIEGATILIGNDYEIALIEQKLGVSHDQLIVMAPIVVTTIGSKGSVIETQKDKVYIKPAKPKNTSDPTGAGDAYRAGFVAGYLQYVGGASGKDNRGLTPDELQVCGQMGSVAAVYTVEQYGTVSHHFTKKEFEKRYQENYDRRIVL